MVQKKTSKAIFSGKEKKSESSAVKWVEIECILQRISSCHINMCYLTHFYSQIYCFINGLAVVVQGQQSRSSFNSN